MCVCTDVCLILHQNQEAEEVVEEVEEVLEAAGQWEWEAFSKEACQNYDQLEVKTVSLRLCDQ